MRPASYSRTLRYRSQTGIGTRQSRRLAKLLQNAKNSWSLGVWAAQKVDYIHGKISLRAFAEQIAKGRRK